MANAVTIQLAVRGAAQTLSALQQVGSQAERLAEQVGQARTAFLAVGGATAGFAAAALASFESAERLRRVLAATVGEDSAGRLARRIMEVAEAANSSGQMLRQFAMNWVSMVEGGERSVVRMMRALDRLGAGLSGADRERVAFQLAQVGSLPQVQWEDLRQLAQAGLPLKLIARQLGAGSARDLAGMDSGLFLEAFARAAEQAPTAAPLPTTRLQNLWEGALNSLAETGAKIAERLDPLIGAAERFLAWFRRMNSDGRLGFSVLTAGLSGSAYALTRYAAAVYRATFALEAMATAATAGAAASAAGGAAGAAGAARLAAAGAARGGMIVGTAGAMVGGLAGQAVGQKLGGDTGAVVGAVAGAALGPTIARLIVAGLGRAFAAAGPMALAGAAALPGVLAPVLAGLIAAAVGAAAGRLVGAGLDALARAAGFESVGDWIQKTFGGGAEAIARAGRAANRADAMAYGYSEAEAERIAGVLARMHRSGRPLKRSDWQNYAANAAAAAARSY